MLTLAFSVAFSVRKKSSKICAIEAVQHPLCRHPALAGDPHAPAGQIQLLRAVSVRVDAEHAPEFERTAVPTPVQVQAVRIGVDLDRNSVSTTLDTSFQIFHLEGGGAL